MTSEEQNIAIAEACPNRFKYFGGRGWYYGVDGSDWMRCVNGSIIEDLNAMHEAEKVLAETPVYMQQHAFNNYAYRLIEVCKHQCNAVHATAAQRAEAFLKTIGKWKD